MDHCGNAGNENGQNDHAEAGRDGPQIRQNGEQAACCHGDSDQSSQKMIFLCRRNDDGKKHSIHGNAESVGDKRGENVPCDNAKDGSEAPAGNRDHGNSIGVDRPKKAVHRNGQAEDFICHAVGKCKPVKELRLRRELLRQRAAHEEIPEIDDNGCGNHFDDSCSCADQSDGGKLAGRSHHGQ